MQTCHMYKVDLAHVPFLFFRTKYSILILYERTKKGQEPNPLPIQKYLYQKQYMEKEKKSEYAK